MRRCIAVGGGKQWHGVENEIEEKGNADDYAQLTYSDVSVILYTLKKG